ncbi:MAG: M13 family metallopeptidase [Oscillospiraceae bacterium]|nr:M13 family metallopeptidase [Oscillospiraceae bacterium]
MKNTRQLLAAILAVLLLPALLQTALAAGTTGLTREQARDILVAAADDYNSGVKKEDVLQGYADGDLALDRPVSRVEALVMLYKAFGELPEPKGDSARTAFSGVKFTDVPEWAMENLVNVFQSGIVAGTSETTLSPHNTVTAEELDLLIRRVYALEGTNLKDDFYAAVNKDWLETAEFPPGYPYSGTLYELSYEVTQQVSALIREIAAGTPEAGSPQEKIKNLYWNILDWDSRNEAGLAPVQSYLDAIDSAENLSALVDVHHELAKELATSLLAGFGVTVDVRDSGRYILTFSSLTPMVLSKEEYAEDGTVAQVYQQYLVTLLTLGGETDEDAAAHAAAYYELEKTLAASMLDRQEYADVSKTSNLYTMAQLKELLPGMELDKLLSASGFSEPKEIVVTDDGLLRASTQFLTEEHLEVLKTAMKLGLLGGYGSTLSRDFMDASIAFQSARYGADMNLPDEDTAAQLVQSHLADYLSEAYVERYFSEQAKTDVENMIQDFLGIYKERIQALDWMSDATKAKALKKLDTMAVNVGYPDNWETYLDRAEIKSAADGGSYFSNILSIAKAARAEAIEEYSKPVDKTAWQMPTYTVNAYYSPTANSINFPAGILQAPLYDVEADATENLGGIGYVIAHEMTHAFDNNGAKYDSKGNAADWWTKSDYTAFEKLCTKAAAFYDGLEVIPGVTCNGTLTLSENIADLGAIACITQAESRNENPDYDTLYRSAAKTWSFTGTREMQIYLAQADVHAPGKLRGSRVLQSCDEFYEAFDIEPGDGMWLAPEERVTIW